MSVPEFIKKVEQIDHSKLLSTTDLKDLGLLKSQTLAFTWRKQGIGPSYIKIGKKYFYPADLLIQWLHSNFHEMPL